MTVFEVTLSADAAEAAVLAVVRFLVGRHPEVTNGAVVLAELNVAFDAVVAVLRQGRCRKQSSHGKVTR